MTQNYKMYNNITQEKILISNDDDLGNAVENALYGVGQIHAKYGIMSSIYDIPQGYKMKVGVWTLEKLKTTPQKSKKTTQKRSTSIRSSTKRTTSSKTKPTSKKTSAKKRPSTTKKPATSTTRKKGRVIKASKRQTGTSSKADKSRKAMSPGKRKSRTGRTYYEYRKNRTDVRGRKT